MFGTCPESYDPNKQQYSLKLHQYPRLIAKLFPFLISKYKNVYQPGANMRWNRWTHKNIKHDEFSPEKFFKIRNHDRMLTSGTILQPEQICQNRAFYA